MCGCVAGVGLPRRAHTIDKGGLVLVVGAALQVPCYCQYRNLLVHTVGCVHVSWIPRGELWELQQCVRVMDDRWSLLLLSWLLLLR